MSKLKIILLALGGLVLVAAIAGCVLLYFHFTSELEEVTAAKDQEITELQEDLIRLGETVTTYQLAVPVVHGQALEVTHLQPVEALASEITNQYITSPADLVNVFYKVDLEPGDPLIFAVIDSEVLTKDLRYIDIVAHAYPVHMYEGAFVDLRIVTDYGQDYIVLSKKRITKMGDQTMQTMLSEEELLRYHSALVDTYINEGTMMYMTLYVEPGYQGAAEPFYPVSQDVLNAIRNNPNLLYVASLETIEKRRERFEVDLASRSMAGDRGEAASGRQATIDAMMADFEAQRALTEEGVLGAEEGEGGATPPAAETESEGTLGN